MKLSWIEELTERLLNIMVLLMVLFLMLVLMFASTGLVYYIITQCRLGE